MITPAQRRALEIIKQAGKIRPREFARKMWPNSMGWRRSCKCGSGGSHQGGGMYLAGGGFLGRLRALELVQNTYESQYDSAYALTAKGRTALNEAIP